MEVLVPHLLAFALSAALGIAPETFVRAPLPVTPAEAYELLTSPMRHVRALDPRIQEILERGVDRAPTMAYLLAALEPSDVIVQIVPSSSMPLSTPARLLLVPNPKAFRFLRIEIRMEGTDDDLVAVLGHELRHALEIAQAPDVRDARTLIALYRRIGHRDGGDRQFDSQAAHDTAQQIRRELYATAANALR
jgi:hypothetical protein